MHVSRQCNIGAADERTIESNVVCNTIYVTKETLLCYTTRNA